MHGRAHQAERARWLQWTILDYEQRAYAHQPPYGDYAVVTKADGELVGLVGLVPRPDWPTQPLAP